METEGLNAQSESPNGIEHAAAELEAAAATNDNDEAARTVSPPSDANPDAVGKVKISSLEGSEAERERREKTIIRWKSGWKSQGRMAYKACLNQHLPLYRIARPDEREKIYNSIQQLFIFQKRGGRGYSPEEMRRQIAGDLEKAVNEAKEKDASAEAKQDAGEEAQKQGAEEDAKKQGAQSMLYEGTETSSLAQKSEAAKDDELPNEAVVPAMSSPALDGAARKGHGQSKLEFDTGEAETHGKLTIRRNAHLSKEYKAYKGLVVKRVQSYKRAKTEKEQEEIVNSILNVVCFLDFDESPFPFKYTRQRIVRDLERLYVEESEKFGVGKAAEDAERSERTAQSTFTNVVEATSPGQDVEAANDEEHTAFTLSSSSSDREVRKGHGAAEGTPCEKMVIRFNAWCSDEYRHYRACIVEKKPLYNSAKSKDEREDVVNSILNSFTFLDVDRNEYTVENAKSRIVNDFKKEYKEIAEVVQHAKQKGPTYWEKLAPKRERKQVELFAPQGNLSSVSTDDSDEEFELESNAAAPSVQSDDDVDAMLEKVSPSHKDETGKAIICSGRGRRTEGQDAYILMIRQNLAMYRDGGEVEKQRITDSIYQKFVFRNESMNGSVLSEQKALSMIRKSFANTYRRTIDGGQQNPNRSASMDKSNPPQDQKRDSTSKPEERAPKKPRLVSTPMLPEPVDFVEPSLDPMEDPDPLPKPPKNSDIDWGHLDEMTRVLRVDFSGIGEDRIRGEDKEHFAKLLQRDDITLVSKGLVSLPKSPLKFLELVEGVFGDRPFHKYRVFEKRENNGQVRYEEVDTSATMKVSDYIGYLRKREEVSISNSSEVDYSFTYHDEDGHEHLIDDVRNRVYYMIDIDMAKNLSGFLREFESSFKLKEILPGNDWCMMKSLPASARPFMGPNCYIAPGGGYTKYHQDGHGTVDSGHTCLNGYNEVIMLRRLPEEHKINAFKLVPTLQEARGVKTTFQQARSALYRLPHDDGSELTQLWATTETVAEWKKMKYCPSIFVLGPGEHVHINKGRLHAFRKLTFDPLPENDCHALLRNAVKDSCPRTTLAPLCISVAWDWMYLGWGVEGISEEVRSTVECARLCRGNHIQPLAIPEASIIFTAQEVVKNPERNFFLTKSPSEETRICRQSGQDIAKAMLPFLRHIVARDLTDEDKGANHEFPLNVRGKPDSHCDALAVTVDPFGNDFFCKLCKTELSNFYFHCDGCEKQLMKDFNICTHCYNEERFRQFVLMHPTDTRRRSDINHLGDTKNKNSCKECACHAGPCKVCKTVRRNGRKWGVCKTCSCDCHKQFTMHCRFLGRKGMEELIEGCEALANSPDETSQVPAAALPRHSVVSHVEENPAYSPSARGQDGETVPRKMSQ